MKQALLPSAGLILIVTAPLPSWSQEITCDTARVHAKAARNVLYVNPAHAVNGNITLSYERFTGSRTSFKVMLSGGEKANYVAIAFDLNYYPASPAAINYFIGGSFMMYESPIVTGVPVSQPWNRFFESPDDQYHVALQLKNGGLLRFREFLHFAIDGAIGPAFNLNEGKWLAVWAIGVNLGIPF